MKRDIFLVVRRRETQQSIKIMKWFALEFMKNENKNDTKKIIFTKILRS